MQGAELDWDDTDLKKAEDNIGLKTAQTSCWRKQFSWDSIGRCSKLVRVRWYVQGFIWQHMWLKTKTLSYDTPTWDLCLLDRAQRREHPLDRCCNIHWTASNTSTAWLTIKCCRVCKTSIAIFLHLPWYITSRLSKHRPSSGKPLAFRGRSGKGWGNFGASAGDKGVTGLF